MRRDFYQLSTLFYAYLPSRLEITSLPVFGQEWERHSVGIDDEVERDGRKDRMLGGFKRKVKQASSLIKTFFSSRHFVDFFQHTFPLCCGCCPETQAMKMMMSERERAGSQYYDISLGQTGRREIGTPMERC